MSNHKKRDDSERKVKHAARKLLRSERFFNHLLDALQKDGLVGEKQSALVLYNVVSSRILPHPLNVFVKGRSSSGKNFLIKSVLRLLPEHAIADITSVSDTAWSYMVTDCATRSCIYPNAMKRQAKSNRCDCS